MVRNWAGSAAVSHDHVVQELQRCPGRIRIECKPQQLETRCPPLKTTTGRKEHIPPPNPPPPHTHTHRETRGPGQSRTPGGPGGGEWPSPDRKTLCKATGRVLGLCTRQGDPGPAVVRRLTVLQERLHGRRHCCGTRSPTACHGNCAVSTFHVGKCRVDDVLQSPRPPSDAESRRRPTCPARVSLET